MNSDIIKNRINDSLSHAHHGYTNHVNRLDDSFDARSSPALSTARATPLEQPIATSSSDHVLEVQIVPQDNWLDSVAPSDIGGGGGMVSGQNGNTSDLSASCIDDSTATIGSRRRRRNPVSWASQYADGGVDDEEEKSGGLWQSMGTILTALTLLLAFVSPPLMLMAPYIFRQLVSTDQEQLLQLPEEQLLSNSCGDGRLAALVFKQVLLPIGWWAVFGGARRVHLPRAHTLRVLITCFVAAVTLVFWLLLAVRVTDPGVSSSSDGSSSDWTHSAGQLGSALCDTLLWLLVVAVLLLLLRHSVHTNRLIVRVVRSPDGVCRHYTLGPLSVQCAAEYLLRQYCVDFVPYNPYLQRPPGCGSRRLSRQSSVNSYKYYDVDTANGHANGTQLGPRVLPGGKRRDGCSHNERFHDEQEHERRVKKRRARLVTAAEDAFTHIRRVRADPSAHGNGVGAPMSASEAAQSVFPSIARPLQKYLRVTRQQPHHAPDAITAHLAQCLTHDAASLAFLQPYLQPEPTGCASRLQRWSLVCSCLPLWRQLKAGCVFQLRRGDVSLLCTVFEMPKLQLLEQVVDPKYNRFQLKLNSETSV